MKGLFPYVLAGVAIATAAAAQQPPPHNLPQNNSSQQLPATSRAASPLPSQLPTPQT
ncbi:hypothetical protein [Sphaerothrix gracilis]|uniref:hypothetical protein n=1 Tax=Sphaerothrix gracilis TaxID=3151835 RepID=UPI0031FCF13C